LYQGDTLEVRGARMDYLQVYDHRRERAGYIRAGQVRGIGLEEADAPGPAVGVRSCAIRRARKRWAWPTPPPTSRPRRPRPSTPSRSTRSAGMADRLAAAPPPPPARPAIEAGRAA